MCNVRSFTTSVNEYTPVRILGGQPLELTSIILEELLSHLPLTSLTRKFFETLLTGPVGHVPEVLPRTVVESVQGSRGEGCDYPLVPGPTPSNSGRQGVRRGKGRFLTATHTRDNSRTGKRWGESAASPSVDTQTETGPGPVASLAADGSLASPVGLAEVPNGLAPGPRTSPTGLARVDPPGLGPLTVYPPLPSRNGELSPGRLSPSSTNLPRLLFGP